MVDAYDMILAMIFFNVFPQKTTPSILKFGVQDKIVQMSYILRMGEHTLLMINFILQGPFVQCPRVHTCSERTNKSDEGIE